ncbi:MAG: hypothetical protein KDC90_06525 [Ignavibacteriae bacterium]|nr:hypothetical protein [Ignavibacteriota bacterium]
MREFSNKKFLAAQNGISRRRFMQISGISALWLTTLGNFNYKSKRVSIVTSESDKIANSLPAKWAANELESTLSSKAINVFRYNTIEGTEEDDFIIVSAGSNSSIANELLKHSVEKIPEVTEALGLVPLRVGQKKILLACGYDVRGLVYALLEIADRVKYSYDPFDSMHIKNSIIEKPANIIRSNQRLFVSEIEDKPWFYDWEMWKEYLTMLTTQRFNRFNLSVGIGHDFLENITDAYFLFAYPFLLSVPGYDVRVPQLPDSERDKNLEMLQFISHETEARGIQFQLGIWMHGYYWKNSPNVNYTIEGITPENHGPYCRDAVRLLLQKCPSISGITFRIHGESGLKEGSYNFWETVFDGVATCGRKVEIDMHAKGISQEMIDTAIATGMPVSLSPKFWAEHLGLPYHQADIREFEIPKQKKETDELMSLSAGSRSFTRYGYADLLREDRPYRIMHRIWPGTQRLLLWGNPQMSAEYSKSFSFCGSAGVELMEPLSFKGRRGSGLAGGRCAYLDESLKPKWDWEKYLYSYRTFGRLAYNPDTEPDVWKRFLTKQFGAGAEAVESALANAFPILPIVLTAHGVSAANNLYWPEIYTNLSIADVENDNPFFDTPNPKVFGNVSPMDPQLFLGINDFADEMLKGECSGKYSPVEYAQWIEDYADAADKKLAEAKVKSKGKNKPEFRRMDIDVSIAIGLGRFFGAKFRSGILYRIFQQTNDRNALELSIEYYDKARNYWIDITEIAKPIYKQDITVSILKVLRGHWLDRLPAIDNDIHFMKNILDETPVTNTFQSNNVKNAISEAMGRPHRDSAICTHKQPEIFQAGKAINLELSVENKDVSVRLYYRHVNHAERFKLIEMKKMRNMYTAKIPADYTDTQFPIQYYFELRDKPDNAWLFPGLSQKLTQQPYFIVRNI